MTTAPNSLAIDEAMTARWSETSLGDAAALVLQIFGIPGRASKLSSERDETFLIHAEHGGHFVLKIANPAERQDVLDFQSNALLHLERVAPELPVPRVIAPLAGGHDHRLAYPDGGVRNVRLLSYLDGEQLHKVPSSMTQAHNLGDLLARLGKGLADYRPIVPDNRLLWDITHTLDLRALVPHVDASRQALVLSVLDQFEAEIVPIQGDLPAQIIHNDFNPHNILVAADDADQVTGIIDFGDLVLASLVNDVAVALSYHIGNPDGLGLVAAFLEGYCAVRRLSAAEFVALGVLIKARLAMTIIITEWRAAERPENRAYILRNHPSALAGLQKLAGIGSDELMTLLAPKGSASWR